MSRLFRSKKAVSPLIATVLLIAFAVALGAVVMNWGSDYVKSQTTQTAQKSDVKIKCSQDVSMSVVEIDGIPKLCYNNATGYERIDFLLNNDGNVALENVKVTVVSNVSTPVTVLINSSFGVADSHFLNMSYNKDTYGYPKKIMFTPQIKISGIVTAQWCPSNALTVNEIPECS